MEKSLDKNIKAIYLDLDGTIFVKGKSIAPETLNVIDALRRRGYLCGIATGRHYLEVKKQLDLIKPDLPVININGSMLYSYRTGKEEKLAGFTLEQSQKILKVIKSFQLSYSIYTSHALVFYFKNDLKHLKQKYLDEQKNEIEINYILPYVFLEKNSDTSFYQANKFMIYTHELSDDLLNEIESKIKDLNIEVQFIKGFGSVIEIGLKNVSKGSALLKVMQTYDYQLNEVLFFGDGENDIEICTMVQNCVAMGNAENKLKKIATFITKSNVENGISYFFENLHPEFLK